MQIKKEHVILAIFIIVLSGYLLMRQSGKTHYELPVVEEIEEADISKLDVRGEDTEFALVRDNDRWYIDPQHYPADDTQVDAMVKEVAGLELTALASESKNYTMYELDEGKRIDVAAYKGDTVLRKFSIGKSAPSRRHTFVMLDGDHRVYHSEGNIKNQFAKSISALRDKQVMKIEEEVLELTIQNDSEEITLFRAAETFPVDLTEEPEGEGEGELEDTEPKWTTGDDRPAKERDVDNIVQTMSKLTCDDFIEDKSKEDFSSPSFTITLKGMEAYTLDVFEKVDNQYQATSSACDYPFLLSEWRVKQIMKDPADLLEEE